MDPRSLASLGQMQNLKFKMQNDRAKLKINFKLVVYSLVSLINLLYYTNIQIIISILWLDNVQFAERVHN